MPTVFAIVVNYNGQALTLDCLASLCRVSYNDLSVLVVDNASTDGSVKSIREQFPGITLLEAGDNLGYPGGNNLGMEYALTHSADYILILNNDMEVDQNMVAALVETAQQHPDAGMICGKVFYYNPRDMIWSAGSRMDMRTGSPELIGCNETDTGQYDMERELESVDGCMMLVTARACKQVGLFDTTYFAYYEDTDWAIRFRRAGFRILYTPHAVAWHKVSATNRQNGRRSPFQVYYHIRNHLLFLSRYSRITLRKHLEMGATLLFNVIKVLAGYDRSLSVARLRGILDFYRGRFGKQVLLHTRTLS
jgi:GT2 family glycosyltransferase